ncbi:uncharacterized protein LOC135386264 isoform X2 [Ornithodoros turicata]|uniref:uncharacterized protein LOC135386264 isoform X2 n=1 Tax=Ornithodoros turicata TaxID=34597 RepID=UPI003138DDBA
MATAFKRTSTILQFLLITVVVLVGSDLTDDEKKGYFTNTTITSAYIGQMRAYCRPLARASKGALQDIAKVFGEMLTLGSTYVATQTMKDNAVKYTNSCISPLIGPVPMWVALVKWNKDGDFIYPGTKWCGAGNKSTEKERYGSGESTDKCCEIHDNATDYMLAKGYHKKSGLTNPSPYTRTNCSDDIELFNCLYNDSSSLSYEFGQVFFDVVHVHCFAHTYPINNRREMCRVRHEQDSRKEVAVPSSSKLLQSLHEEMV